MNQFTVLNTKKGEFVIQHRDTGRYFWKKRRCMEGAVATVGYLEQMWKASDEETKRRNLKVFFVPYYVEIKSA